MWTLDPVSFENCFEKVIDAMPCLHHQETIALVLDLAFMLEAIFRYYFGAGPVGPSPSIYVHLSLITAGGHLHLRRRRVQQELRLRVRPLLRPQHHHHNHDHHDDHPQRRRRRGRGRVRRCYNYPCHGGRCSCEDCYLMYRVQESIKDSAKSSRQP